MTRPMQTSAGPVDLKTIDAFDVLGPTVKFLTPFTGSDEAPCIILGVIPPGGIVPLHTHRDPEIFVCRSGRAEGLSEQAEGFRWIAMQPGDVFYVPGGAKHAFRNRTSEPASSMIVTTERLGSFLRQVSLPEGDPAATALSPARVEHFLKTADDYGYWIASPEENERLGLALPVEVV
jgi:quercetin dioxygenase-like cupin family protein